jgi:S-adenosylmethionine-diacylglycerol 3-amino-3-carboxypropyl transferase
MSTAEIAAHAAFDTIRYAQVWEDADMLVEALKPKAGDVVVSIASAGDNALALLAEGPEKVIAVDLSAAQLACVRLRMAAYARLSHLELLQLIGSRPSSERGALLDRVARTLSTEDQAFWAERRDGVVRYGAGGVGKFESYFRIFRRNLLPLVHGQNTVRALLEPRTRDERERFYDERWNTRRWRGLLSLFFSRPIMGRLGRDPAFFAHVEGSVAEHVARKTKQALVEQDPSQNPYLAWILTGRHFDALPRALRPENFDAIRTRLDRLELRQGAIEALAADGVRADAFNLSDIFEYMSPPAHAQAYQSVLSSANPGARIAYWNMMAPRRAPDVHAASVEANTDLATLLKPRDKAFFYADFVLESVRR